MQILAARGYAASTIDLAVVENLASVYVIVVKRKNPRTDFLTFHTQALTNVRFALGALNTATSTLLQAGPDDPITLDAAKILTALQDAKRITLAEKQQILATTFESIPQTTAELQAFIRAGRGQYSYYTLGSTWGLTKEDLCRAKSTPITISGNMEAVPTALGSRANTSTGIAVSVSSDGVLRSAQIVRSSGSDDQDVAALTKAYHLKYHAATKHCAPVSSKRVGEII